MFMDYELVASHFRAHGITTSLFSAWICYFDAETKALFGIIFYFLFSILKMKLWTLRQKKNMFGSIFIIFFFLFSKFTFIILEK